MNGTRIEVVAPLERAWRRTHAFLFRPFDLGRWMIVGFGAWLAGMQSCGGGVSIPTPPSGIGDAGGSSSSGGDWGGFGEAAAWLAGHWMIVAAGVATLALFFLAWVGVLIWLQARGSFVFLDNVAFRRAAVVDPFTRHGAEADSAFLWQAGLAAVVVAAIVVVLGPTILVVATADVPAARVLALLAGGSVFLVVVLAAAVVGHLFKSFVLPLMMLHRLRATAAWRRLLPALRAHPGSFALYLLFYWTLTMLLGMAIVVAGLLTCCIGFLLLAIPYLGTVALLPAWVLLRTYSLEFLAQLGPDYDLLAAPPPASS